MSPESWWDGRRGRRYWNFEARIEIKRHLTAIAPDLYIYFDTPYDLPDRDFDPRWEAIACALEDAYYAEAYRSRLIPARIEALRGPWKLITGQETTAVTVATVP